MTGDYVIRILCLALPGQPTEYDGTWIRDYAPSSRRHGGLDGLRVTRDPGEAKRFFSSGLAASFWRQEHGLRPDGKPNRPLTAFTVCIERLGEIA
jgi:hypothetical protein